MVVQADSFGFAIGSEPLFFSFKIDRSPDTAKSDSITPKETITTVPRSQRKIHTLDPSKLVKEDYVDFSRKSCGTVGIILQPSWLANSPIPPPPRNAQFRGNPWGSKRFPNGTHGFIYYHVPPYSSPLAGELRFRITSSCDPASFASGSDLLTERSMPWRYPLYKIVCRPYCSDFVALLLQDALISQRTLDLVTAAVKPLYSTSTSTHLALSENARHPGRLPSTPVLSAFGQEFDFRYGVGLNFCGIFASQDSIVSHHMRFISTFRVLTEGKYVRYCPFEGSLVCSFERSTLPEHVGKRVVVIRVKRFIDSDPVRLAPLPEQGDRRANLVEKLWPREGELLKTVGYHHRVQPWVGDVDKLWTGRTVGIAPWKALRVLFENEELYGSEESLREL
ncbi:hypothetical protein GSI_10002 [Ganoderma sinense ZZ0214-1]|uniref:Uncharacterized protein n=1 Tax=Ganoderma sinense ZZ0214-1 TaxID=1077348 RepID=A0A2G8S282_9APHY|nr:hypothetical protein GSI_10002 [Ganoderma sinense ZZ0214-1]